MTAPLVACERVGFAYAAGTAGAFAIRDLSFEVRPGETFGVIGPNASGKTTLVRLLSKVVAPSSGRICLDGINTRDLRRDDVRRADAERRRARGGEADEDHGHRRRRERDCHGEAP